MFDPLLNISPLDGRYREKLECLCNYFSEMALMRYRLAIEVEWFIFLCNTLKLKETIVLPEKDRDVLRKLYEDFSLSDAEKVKEIEATTNHDVKAIEYFLVSKIESHSTLKKNKNFIHFGCTSEDINNMAYNLMMKDFLEDEFEGLAETLINEIKTKAKLYKKVSMLSHTHGQPASPSTMGKEFLVFATRMERQLDQIRGLKLLAKFSGAVGNYNAHCIAYPKINWPEASKEFIEQFGLYQNPLTTQIEPHDTFAEVFDTIRRLNTILIDFNRDMWSYVSLGYLKQKTKKSEIGSSTMPHKVNPIDFENSEGNLGLANALWDHLSNKLPVSRLQRDLSDSTVQRNIGVAFGYTVLAYMSTIKGLKKVEIDEKKIKEDLENNWEVLAEAVQTVMRKNGIEKPYEKLKELTRGKKISKKTLHEFIKKLKLPKEDKEKLLKLTPESYHGTASFL